VDNQTLWSMRDELEKIAGYYLPAAGAVLGGAGGVHAGMRGEDGNEGKGALYGAGGALAGAAAGHGVGVGADKARKYIVDAAGDAADVAAGRMRGHVPGMVGDAVHAVEKNIPGVVSAGVNKLREEAPNLGRVMGSPGAAVASDAAPGMFRRAMGFFRGR
jgi:hypothetical protein